MLSGVNVNIDWIALHPTSHRLWGTWILGLLCHQYFLVLAASIIPCPAKPVFMVSIRFQADFKQNNISLKCYQLLIFVLVY